DRAIDEVGALDGADRAVVCCVLFIYADGVRALERKWVERAKALRRATLRASLKRLEDLGFGAASPERAGASK
ncbi:MAG TPA: hypothetical protein VLA09_09945, partial [Longimicrobiales bacterium]|nr:hypothetical protein [Longimicrobiales bacterium]